MYKIYYIYILDNCGYTNEEMYALISLWVKLDNPSPSKIGGNDIYILQLLQNRFYF